MSNEEKEALEESFLIYGRQCRVEYNNDLKIKLAERHFQAVINAILTKAVIPKPHPLIAIKP